MFSEKTIMVTGGTGSIGQYLIRKMCKENPKRIIVYSRDEEKQYFMQKRFMNKNIEYYVFYAEYLLIGFERKSGAC